MAELDPLAFQKSFQASQSMFDKQRQNKLQDLLMGQKVREIEQENKLASLYQGAVGEDGKIDRTKLVTGAAQSGLGNKIPALQTQFAQQDKAQMEQRKAQLEQGLKQVEVMGQLMSGVRDQASYDAARQQAVGILGPDAASKMPPQFDPAMIEQGRMRAMSVKEQMEQEWKRLQFDETQRHNQVTEGLSSQGQQITMRGQDMNDKRARESNVIQADIKRLQLAEAENKAREKDQTKQAAISSAEDSLAILDKALNHPGRETATGVSGVADPRNYWPGSNARNFQVVLDQIKGQAFLQAFQSLKGGGQITEVEGKKATDAIGRLDRAQSDEEFKVALQDLRGVMQRGYDRLKGAQSGAQAGTSGAKKIGSKAEYDAMPSGTLFVAPDGTTRRKP